MYFDLAYSADPDEMLHFVAFHLGLHYLPKYPFSSFSGITLYSIGYFFDHDIIFYFKTTFKKFREKIVRF